MYLCSVGNKMVCLCGFWWKIGVCGIRWKVCVSVVSHRRLVYMWCMVKGTFGYCDVWWNVSVSVWHLVVCWCMCVVSGGRLVYLW